MSTSTIEWEKIRALFPVTREYIYLNNASNIPMNLRTAEGLDRFERNSATKELWNEKTLGTLENCRGQVASLINAAPSEIAFIRNLGMGLDFALNSIGLLPQDQILVPEDEQAPLTQVALTISAAQNIYIIPIKRHGAFFDMEEFEKAITPKVRAVALEYVHTNHGFKRDIEAIGKLCRERGIVLIVDATQAMGAIPVDVIADNIDVLVAGGYRWLLASFGIGVIYIRKELLDSKVFPLIEWLEKTLGEDYENKLNNQFPLFPGRGLLPYGDDFYMNIYALDAGISLIRELGIDAIARRDRQLIDHLVKKIEGKIPVFSSMDEKHRSAIISLIVENLNKMKIRLIRKNIRISIRDNKIRVSPHFFNNFEEIDALAETMLG